jgi:hypothetical protein
VATVVLTGTYIAADGTGPAAGIVSFTPNAILADGTSTPPDMVVPKPLTVVLGAGGSFSATLMATDDPHLSPSGWAYTVVETIIGYSQRTYLIQLPAAQTPIDLSTVAPLSTPPAQVAYILASARGAPSGVASLDGTGSVPLSQLGNAPGGTPSGTVVAETSYGQSSSAGTATPYSRGDHTHGSPPLTSSAPSTSAVGDAAAAGTGTTPARSDHIHGREAFGAVTAQTSYGQAPSNGTATTVARADHTHGTPAATPDATTLAKGVVQLAGDLAGTAAAPTVPGLSGKVPTSRQVASGTGLTGGGDLSADRTLAVVYGTGSGTAAQGDDSRITGAVQASTATTKGDLLVASAAATITRLGVGSNGQVLVADSAQTAGLAWGSVASASVRVAGPTYITSGDVTLPANASWTVVAGFELDIAAAVGDYVELSPSGMLQTTGSDFFDLAVIVGLAIVRRSSTGTASPTPVDEGDASLYPNPGTFRTTGTLFNFVVTSGDRDSGNVRFALIAKGVGGSKVFASANYPWRWTAKNYGPPG